MSIKKQEAAAAWFAENAKHRHIVSTAKMGMFKDIFRDRNIQGVAYGRRDAHGERTDEPALVVYVARKMSTRFLPPSRILPRRIYIGGDSIEVDVVQTGFIYPLSFTARERPATLGISVGNANEPSAGTLGGLMIDNTTGADVILSNNHVLARVNAAAIGEDLVQQGVFDGGAAPADVIAQLTRFTTINANGNTVDGAIGTVSGAGLVVNQVHNNIIATASVNHPAVGLLFAGSCNRTIMNPIADVLAQLNIRFPGTGPTGAQPTVAATIGMNVEKVGRTTEYTSSTVTEIDLTTTVDYGSMTAGYDHQIATMWMSDRGDSGSLVYEGGEGGAVDNCSGGGGCAGGESASSILGQRVDTEGTLAANLRDRYLRHTRIGAWAIKLYYANVDRFAERHRRTRIDEDDLSYARKLYAAFGDEARAAAAAPERAERVLSQSDLAEGKKALRRLKKYLDKREMEAAERLFKLAEERLVGRTTREALAMLQDEKLHAILVEIAEGVPSLRKHGCDCD